MMFHISWLCEASTTAAIFTPHMVSSKRVLPPQLSNNGEKRVHVVLPDDVEYNRAAKM